MTKGIPGGKFVGTLFEGFIPLDDIDPDTDVLSVEPMLVVVGKPSEEEEEDDDVDTDDSVVALAEIDEVEVVETLALPLTEDDPELRPPLLPSEESRPCWDVLLSIGPILVLE